MVFTHNQQPSSADQFDLLSYGNLRGLETDGQLASLTEISSTTNAVSKSHVTDFVKEDIFDNSEESKTENIEVKDSASTNPEKFSFSWFLSNDCQSGTLGHGKRPFSDIKPYQVACKRPKQTAQSSWLYTFEEHAFSSAADTSSTSALAGEFVGTREPDHISFHNGTTTRCVGSGTPCSKHEQFIGEESLYSTDWMTAFPSYFEDYGLVATYDEADDIDSPIHECLPRKAVAIGPDHQADIPEWRPRVSVDAPGVSGSCADLPLNYSTSESTSTFVDHRDEGNESERWIRYCVMPTPLSNLDPVGRVRDYKTDCGCSDEGSVRCVRQHVVEARESLKRSLGQDKFKELGLCEMGEDATLRWTDEEEKLFQRVVFSNPVSLGKNFWSCLPDALPGKTSKELVSYYFNVFILRKRAQQNRSDLMHVDSDDDEMPECDDGEPAPLEQDEEDSGVESPTYGYHVNNSVSIDDVHEESEEESHEFSFPDKVVDNAHESRCCQSMMPMESNREKFVDDLDMQDESCTSFEGQHTGAQGPNGVQCADQAHMMPNDTLDNYVD